MSNYSVHFYGVDLTEILDEVESHLRVSDLATTDPKMLETLEGEGIKSVITEHGFGTAHYDGGGWFQITYIGVDIPQTSDGTVVTPEHKLEAQQLLVQQPVILLDAIKAACGGTMPKPEFHVRQGWG